MAEVGRNEPCPCGSGKKYKKCCAGANVSQIDHIILEELERVFGMVVDFAYEKLGWKLDREKDKIMGQLPYLPEFDLPFYTWFLLTNKGKEERTILEQFINENLNAISRVRVREIVRKWGSYQFVCGKLVDRKGDLIIVEDFLSSERFELRELDMPFSVGQAVFTAAMPYENQQHVPFTTFFNFSPEVSAFVEKIVKESYEETSMEVQHFYRRNFLVLMEKVFRSFENDEDIHFDIGALPWRNETEQEAGQELHSFVLGHSREEEYAFLLTKYLSDYFKVASPRIRNPRVYAAALYYLCSEVFPIVHFSQKELGVQFDVSAGSISNRAYVIDEKIGEQIGEDISKLSTRDESDVIYRYGNDPAPTEKSMWEMVVAVEKNDSGLELDEVINKVTEGKMELPDFDDKEKAQSIAYDAYEKSGSERYVLCANALILDPHCADAVNILAEKETKAEKKIELLEKAVEYAEKDVKLHAEEDMNFWMYVRTRPYMRVTLNLAIALKEAGQYEKAASHMEHLIQLNREDNQGVRYELLPILIELGKRKQVERIMANYEEESAYQAYMEFFLAMKYNRNKVQDLADSAVNLNPYPMAYILGFDPLPEEMPTTFAPGSEEEGIIIAKQTKILWKNSEHALKQIIDS
jgi:tetratricopeptide (TPR) repeat protein